MTTQTVPSARTIPAVQSVPAVQPAPAANTVAPAQTAEQAHTSQPAHTGIPAHTEGLQADPAVAAKPGRLRLTRRGRLVFIGVPLMLAAAAALAVLGFFTAPAMAASGEPDVTRTVQVSVAAGETLWGLAQEFAPERDPRDVMEDIMELNSLTDPRLTVGDRLYIPVEG